MNELLFSSAYFCTALTLIIFAFAAYGQRKLHLAVFNPILVSALVIIGILNLLDIPCAVYQEGCRVLTYLLTPATICLAISFFEQLGRLKAHLLPIFAGVLAGVVCSLGSIYLLGNLLVLPETMIMSLLPKSVTTAIGVVLSEELGGIAAVTTASIIITGIFGNIIGPALCKWMKITNPIAQGVALGTSAHVIGTARAAAMSELAGAVSSLSLTVAGLVTSILLSFLAP